MPENQLTSGGSLELLDLGTRTCRLLRFAPGGSCFGQTVFRRRHHLFDAGMPDADALQAVWTQIHSHVDPRAVFAGRATGKFRVYPRLQAVLGDLSDGAIELLPKEEEVRLATLGAIVAMPSTRDSSGWLIIDMGGGSTELGIVSATGSFGGGASFAVGSHSERETTEIGLTKIETFLDHKYHEIHSLDAILTCGAATRLAMEHLALSAYDASAIHGCRIPAEFLTVGASLAEEVRNERILLRQILSAARKRWVTVSESGWPQALAQQLRQADRHEHIGNTGGSAC